MSDLILAIMFSILAIPGIFLVFIPFVPALPYMLVVALVFGVIDGFVRLAPVELGILAVIVILSAVVDWGAGALGAKYGGAHIKSVLWGIIGAIIGTFIFFPFGGLVGLLIAILASEIYYRPNYNAKTINAVAGALLGTTLGMAVNCILAVMFFASFVIFIVF